MSVAALVLFFAPAVEAVDFGSTTARRLQLLRHEHAGVRRRAALLLAHGDADRVIAGLLHALSDRHAGVRYAAVHSLARLSDERAVPFLVRRLREEQSERVLPALLLALARSGQAYAGRFVAPFLEHPSELVRAAAATALGELGDAAHRDELWAALRFAPSDPSFRVRAAVLGAFARQGWTEDVRRAVAELEAKGAHRHWRSRIAIVAAAGAARLEERVPWILELLATDGDPRVVAAAAATLAHVGRLDEVAAALAHDSPEVRRAALVALVEAADPRGLPAAARLVREDPDAAVRFECALLLHETEHPDGDIYLVDALRSRNALFWVTALGALEERHGRSFGRDPDAWTKFLEASKR